MFKNFKLSTKIILGFLVVVALVAVAGVTGYWGVDKIGEALNRVANEEAQILDAGSEMRLSVEQGKRIAEELKNATSALATDDLSQVDDLVDAFTASVETFDAYADAILSGSDVDGEAYIATDNEELAAFVRQTDDLHNDKFQPAFVEMKEAGLALVAAKEKANEAMETMEGQADSALASADAAETSAGAEIAAAMVAANIEGEAKRILEEEVPLIDCTMEIKVAILNSRICLEEVSQSTSVEEIDSVVERYNQTIEDADEIIFAVLKGGDIDGNVITATDNADIRRAIEELDEVHAGFQAAADAMIAAQRDMVQRAQEADDAMLAPGT